MTPLVLASTSPYRKELLQRLGLKFEAQRPLFDADSGKLNSTIRAFTPDQLCLYLGEEKAKSLAQSNNCVIGGDQILVLNDEILGKPGTNERAFSQLQKMQGKTHELLTSVSVFYQQKLHQFLNRTRMTMTPLTHDQIQHYVDLDQPLDCAGSYKIEKHGITLFEKIDTEDFTAIQGLPLLQLARTLRQLGYIIPAPSRKVVHEKKS